MPKKHSKYTERTFSTMTRICQIFAANFCVMTWAKLNYKVVVEGRENVPKDKNKRYIIACNHISAYDPFLVAAAVNVPVSFMAKQELFEKAFTRFIMTTCGAFAVNREKPDISTMKTALSITKTNWHLAMFPQGTRCHNEKLENISDGFALISKKTKTDILPVSIVGADKPSKWYKKQKLTIKIGEILPYHDNMEEITDTWATKISEMTGFEYIKNKKDTDRNGKI